VWRGEGHLSPRSPQQQCQTKEGESGMTLFEKVRQIVVNELQVPESTVTESAMLEGDLEADSLDVVEIQMTLEEQFGVEIPETDFKKIETVGDLARYIGDKLDGGGDESS
jgi:acyl carrier protein